MTTVIESGTFAEDMRQQTAILQHMADSITERGWCVSIVDVNKYTTMPGFLYPYLGGGFSRMNQEWGDRHGMTPIMIHVFPDRPVSHLTDYQSALFDPLHFHLEIEALARLRPITVAIEMTATKVDSVSPPTQSLCFVEKPGSILVRGRGRMQLETIVNILNMPVHREILLGKVRRPIRRRGSPQ